MQEIVPPKLNEDTTLYSLILNRRSIVILLAGVLSFLFWNFVKGLTFGERIFGEILIGIILIPLLFDAYGRPLHAHILDALKYFFSKKEQQVVLAKEVKDNFIVATGNKYCRVYKVEPINLTMGSPEELISFKTYMQQALFSLSEPIQLITIQRYAEGIKEPFDLSKLDGQLKECASRYLQESQTLTQTMQRDFYLVTSTNARSESIAKEKLQDYENSFCKLFEQTKISLKELNQEETLSLIKFLTGGQNVLSS